MFENLLHQDLVIHRLVKDASDGSLPPALLFSGPAHAGKLTAALELARVLSCAEDGRWQCPCAHCRSHRALAHSRTLLAGHRDLLPEIDAAVDVLLRDGSDAPRYLLVRSARKLLRRFDPVLWEGDEKKLVKARTSMERLAETVDVLLPGKALPGRRELKKAIKALKEDCALLQKTLPSQLPVSQVRRITSWAVHSASGDHKTIILDGADKMPDASRNALLKFLEEPPADTTAILITDRKSLLLPTIVSRLRDYAFRGRRVAEEADVLRRVFREEEDRWGGLGEFFRSRKSGPSHELQSKASQFLDGAKEGIPALPEGLSGKDHGDFVVFLEALLLELRRRWEQDDQPAHQQYQREVALIRDARLRTESLNLPHSLVLKSLHVALGAPHA
ncbi:MAG: DNA polymerase III [Spirochaetales bacterium]|nr:DNA polymerase III [Spirochaetales bacterium]